jgi:N-acetyl-gamma-glutamylphosphate reductase
MTEDASYAAAQAVRRHMTNLAVDLRAARHDLREVVISTGGLPEGQAAEIVSIIRDMSRAIVDASAALDHAERIAAR